MLQNEGARKKASFFHHGAIVSTLLVLKGFYQKEEFYACDKFAD